MSMLSTGNAGSFYHRNRHGSLISLIASIAALLLGPLTYGFARRGRAMLPVLDGLVFVAVSGLVLITVLPGAMGNGGWQTAVFLAMGFAGPTLVERLFHSAAKSAHLAALIVGIVGISLHALVDGVALSGPAAHGMGYLPAAIVVHRFPVGLAIWWLLRPHFGSIIGGTAIGLIAAATAAGFWIGPALDIGMGEHFLAWLQAFVAGSLLHVVFYRPHLDGNEHSHPPSDPLTNRLEGIGAILGGALILGVMATNTGNASPNGLGSQISDTFLGLALETAPALLLAYLMAGMVSVFLPTSSVKWMGRGGPLGQSLRGMAVGLPLPICSCGVVPLYRTFVKKGAPPAAAIAFLVATPELGLDAIFISVPLLGPDMAIVRVVAAAAVALSVGWWVGRTIPTVLENHDGDTGKSLEKNTVAQRITKGLRIGFSNVVDDTAPWILAGLGVAALAAPLLETGTLAALPGGADVILFALIGIPTYVCASAATPLAAVLLVGGLSPGAALAFLITGPATNVTTFGVISQLHGRKAAMKFSLAIIGVSVTMGFLVNAILPNLSHVPLATMTAETASPIKIAAVIILAAVFTWSVLRRGPRGFMAELKFT